MNSNKTKDNPGVIAFPPLIWLVAAVMSELLHYFFPHPIMDASVSRLIGIALVVIALSLAFTAILAMRRAGTNIDPAKPALTIVRKAPYRFTRNPMYLSLCLLQVGLGFMLNDWSALLLVVPLALVLHYGVILREEKYLETKFGEPYLAFKREVRRWI